MTYFEQLALGRVVLLFHQPQRPERMKQMLATFRTNGNGELLLAGLPFGRLGRRWGEELMELHSETCADFFESLQARVVSFSYLEQLINLVRNANPLRHLLLGQPFAVAEFTQSFFEE